MSKSTLGKSALFFIALIWGTSFVIMKNVLDGIPVLWLLSFRFILSSLILLAVSARKIWSVSRECLKGSVILGLLLGSAYIVQTFGLYYTTPGKNAFLTCTYCVLTPFASWILYKTRPSLKNLLAAAICLAGIGCVSLDAGFDNINIGDVLTLACGILYALQIAVMAKYVSTGDPILISGIEFGTAGLLCLVLALLFQEPPEAIPAGSLFSLLYLAVVCTCLCFLLQTWGMKYTPPATAGILMSLESVFGVIISVIFYHEVLTPVLLLGFALIFFAVVYNELPEKKKSA